MLVLVAMAYGSLSVSLKLVFESAGAPTAGVLGGVRGLMTVLCFAPMLMAKDSKGGEGFETGAGFWRSAAELAFWNLGNQGLCNVALLFTDATRVSFFTQASIAFTPFIASLGGDKVKSMTWLGCALAFCGVAVLGMDGGAAAELGGKFQSRRFTLARGRGFVFHVRLSHRAIRQAGVFRTRIAGVEKRFFWRRCTAVGCCMMCSPSPLACLEPPSRGLVGEM